MDILFGNGVIRAIAEVTKADREEEGKDIGGYKSAT